MENKKSSVNLIYVLVLIAIAAALAVALAPSGSEAAEDCLRGNQSACAYFQAQEEVNRIQQELQSAKEVQITAQAEYQNSKK